MIEIKSTYIPICEEVFKETSHSFNKITQLNVIVHYTLVVHDDSLAGCYLKTKNDYAPSTARVHDFSYMSCFMRSSSKQPRII